MSFHQQTFFYQFTLLDTHTLARSKIMDTLLEPLSLMLKIYKFCEINTEIGTDLNSEKSLNEWIKKTKKFVNDVIPQHFWQQISLNKPNPKNVSICKVSNDRAISVLLLVVWSQCSSACFDHITACLKHGDKK